MELLFNDDRLLGLCNSKAALVRKWGKSRANVISQRLQELHALDSLADVRLLPHLHIRRDGRRGSVRISVDEGASLVLTPAGESADMVGSQKWEQVTAVIIIEIHSDDQEG